MTYLLAVKLVVDGAAGDIDGIFLGIATRCGVTTNDGTGNAIVEIDGVAYDIKSTGSCAAYEEGGCAVVGVDSIAGYAGAAEQGPIDHTVGAIQVVYYMAVSAFIGIPG